MAAQAPDIEQQRSLRWKEASHAEGCASGQGDGTFLVVLRRCWAQAISKAPAPGTTAPSSRVFFTARSPSRMASFICASVWSAGPCAQHRPMSHRLRALA